MRQTEYPSHPGLSVEHLIPHFTPVPRQSAAARTPLTLRPPASLQVIPRLAPRARHPAPHRPRSPRSSAAPEPTPRFSFALRSTGDWPPGRVLLTWERDLSTLEGGSRWRVRETGTLFLTPRTGSLAPTIRGSS